MPVLPGSTMRDPDGRQGAVAAAALVWFLLILVLPAAAETWPRRGDLHVTDLADVLTAPEESRLRTELAALKAETGVTMAVLTLRSRADYDATRSLAEFATGVFNAWGIGTAERNDGILILVATEDRELRIALGAGYDQGYDVLAEQIAARAFLPELREGSAASAILTGSREVMARIARRHAAGLGSEAPMRRTGDLPTWLPFAVVAAGIAVIAFRRRGRDVTQGHAPRRKRDSDDRRDREDRKRNRTDRDIEGDRAEDGRSSGGGGTGRW